MKTLLEIKDLSIGFKTRAKVLEKINLSISSGEIVSIIGRNGAGKSTLLKIIAWIESWYTGEITKYFSHLAYVPQKIDIDNNFPLSVSEFISIYNPGVTRVRMIELLNLLDGGDLIDACFHNLSWGQKQKVLIVSALISDPELVLLDEPTAGIDVMGEEQFYKMIETIKQYLPNLSLILVSHNLHLVYKNSDRVICLHNDNYCCHGKPIDPSVSESWDIFWDYVAAYAHHPHKKHTH